MAENTQTQQESKNSQSQPNIGRTPVSIPQSLQILYQAVNIAQSKGVYSLDDSALIKLALDSLRVRLQLDANFQIIAPEQTQTQAQQAQQAQPQGMPRSKVPMTDCMPCSPKISQDSRNNKN